MYLYSNQIREKIMNKLKSFQSIIYLFIITIYYIYLLYDIYIYIIVSSRVGTPPPPKKKKDPATEKLQCSLKTMNKKKLNLK